MRAPAKSLAVYEVRENLKTAIELSGMTYSALSKAIGKNASYIHQFIHRGTPRRLREEDRLVLARILNLDERELGKHLDPTSEVLTKNNSLEVVSIEIYDVAASAGDGALPDREHVIGAVTLPRSIIRSASSTPDMLKIIAVQGDSMQPTLRDGDQLLVDFAVGRVKNDGIYVLNVNGALHVKRLVVNPGTRCITVKSDNPLFEAWSDIDPQSLTIIGRAIWAARSL